MPLLSPRMMALAFGIRPAALRLSLLLTVSAVAIPGAEAQLVLGTPKTPSVTVDWGVLDRLGPPPTLPQLLLQQRGLPASRPLAAAPGDSAKLVAPRPVTRTAHTHRATRHLAAHHHRPSKHRIVRKTTAPTHLAQVAAPSPSEAAVPKPPIHLARPAPLPSSRPEEAAQPQMVAPPTQALAAKEPTPPPSPAVPAETAPPAALPPERVANAAPPSPPSGDGDSRNSPAPSSSSLLRVRPPTVPAPTPATRSEAAASPAAAAKSAPAVETPPVAAAAPPAATSSSSLLRVATPAVPAPTERMVASLTPQLGPATAGVAAAAVTSAVRFGPGIADIPPDAKPVLDAIVAKLKGNDALRVQLIAHAAGGDEDAIEARRLSLARAVAVRAYLIEGGVRSLRMDVRALGNRADGGGPSDRVDLVIVNQ